MTASQTLERLGRVRVLVFGILAVAYMSVFFHRIAPAVVAGELMKALGTTGAELGSLAATYYYVYTVMQIPAGVLADTLGVRVVAGAGALVTGVGSVIFGLAPSLFLASVGRLLVGLGVSVVFVGMMRANTVWWSERRYGLISGLTLLLGNVGAILAAGPLATLLQVVSWRAVFVVAGALSMVIAVATFAFVRNRPEDAGFPSLRELEGGAPHAPRAQHWVRDLASVLRTPAIWPPCFVTFGMCGSLLALIGLWAVPFLRDVHGLSRVQASLYTTVSLAGLAIGSLAQGAVSDRIARRKPVLMGAAWSSLLVWLAFAFLPWSPGPSGFVLFALFGLCCGGFVVAFGTAKEVVAPALAGMAIAVVNAGLFLGAALAQPLFGWLLDRSWDGTVVDGVRRYRPEDHATGVWLFVGLSAFSALVSLLLRETHCRNQTGSS
jgi:sugar phosphate permease